VRDDPKFAAEPAAGLAMVGRPVAASASVNQVGTVAGRDFDGRIRSATRRKAIGSRATSG
jgi:hypothetical protein